VPSTKRVIVYVDGFALYKGLLARHYPQYKWLDLTELARNLYVNYEVVKVRYFTAHLKPFTNDPQIPQRQMAYLRALKTLPLLEIHYGKYIFSKQWLPYHPEKLNDEGKVQTVRVKRPEEKGSDVSLASHLILDAFRNRADLYAVVTNDSDLVEPMRLLAEEEDRNIALVSLSGSKYNKAFNDVPRLSVREIREGSLRASQLPVRLQDAEARWIHKPKSWP